NLSHGQWVRQQGGDASDRAVWLTKNAKLPKQRCPVVVDPLARQAFALVECINSAQRKSDLCAGRWQPTPWAKMLSANDDLEDDRGVAGVSMQHVNPQSGQRLQQSLVKRTHGVASNVVRVPWLVVIVRGAAKGRHDGFKVMIVLMPDVLVDKLEACR